jgi:DNA-binding PadR family transcriptional regulator
VPRSPDTSPQTLRLFEALLAHVDQWHYGYALSKSTGLASGTLYPILQRLAERGLLDAQWQDADEPGRPPRHAYRLTGDGASYATERVTAGRARAAGPVRSLRPRSAS